MKKTILFLVCLVMFMMTGCGGDEEKTEDDSKALYMTIAQTAVEKYLSDVDYPWSGDEWQVIENDDGTTSIITHVTLKGDSEKKLLNVIVTVQQDNKFITHFVEVAGTVYLDDGTIE